VDLDPTDDRLADLLTRADRAADAPALAADLPGRVSRRARRRAVARRCGVTAAAIVVASTVSWAVTARHQQPAPEILATTKGSSDLTAEVARLRDEAELHRLTAEAIVRLRADRRERQLAAKAPTRPDPLDALAWQRERAALILVDRADRMSRDAGAKPLAVAAYRRAAELFPGTYWADVAAERLHETHRY